MVSKPSAEPEAESINASDEDEDEKGEGDAEEDEEADDSWLVDDDGDDGEAQNQGEPRIPDL